MNSSDSSHHQTTSMSRATPAMTHLPSLCLVLMFAVNTCRPVAVRQGAAENCGQKALVVLERGFKCQC